MRTIIAGGRKVWDPRKLYEALSKCGWSVTRVVCGGAEGADSLGEEWAKSVGIPVDYYLADWSKYGRKAGMIRNKEMSENAEALIALWDGESKGTANMINLAKRKGLRVHVELI